MFSAVFSVLIGVTKLSGGNADRGEDAEWQIFGRLSEKVDRGSEAVKHCRTKGMIR